ncbi:MAG: ACP S-malonyltransferase [Acidimicrobiia bacterium]
MSFGVLFPGQGSQYVGMGSDLFEVSPEILGDRADDILGWSLRDLCLDGPEEKLTRTEFAQPALFAISYALWEIFNTRVGKSPAGAAGHSLGEYTALCAADAIGFDTALGLVSKRGHAMQVAADSTSSGMAALLGGDLATVETVVAANVGQGGTLQIANVNAPGQVVVAGARRDIEWLGERGRDFGVRRVVPLKVAGAFHSSFMEPAASAVEEALSEVSIDAPRFPVWSNTTAQPHVGGQIPAVLARQVMSPVLFSQSLLDMSRSGMGTFVHIGPGDVTAGMARRSVDDAEVVVVSSISEVGDAVSVLGTMA